MIKRYALENIGITDDIFAMMEDIDGDFVKYEDHAAEVNRILAERKTPQPEAAAEYAKRNPLGGPAVVFEAMASRIRAGEDYYDVLDDYGFMVKPSSSGPQNGEG
jgi:hypothetical protein